MHSDNLGLLEEYWQLYQKSPKELDSSWSDLFSVAQPALEAKRKESTTIADAFRKWGHTKAAIYPEGIKERKPAAELEGLRDDALGKTYCSRIGYEFFHIASLELRDWLIKEIEPKEGNLDLSKETRLKILELLGRAESFETFLHTKYVGQKRFSLEGAETLIPMLYALYEKEVDEIVIGMPHRGRLNVLFNILNKSHKEIFSEFEDIHQESFEGSGDVKYHKGYASKIALSNGRTIQVILAANPSHLESVDAVCEGIARAKQTAKNDTERQHVIPVLIHGDAALSGQGVVYETLQLSKLEGYTTGGTIHIVINNHIGFTTVPENSRSTEYCTDIAKAFGVPVLHVNAEDPDACISAMHLAFKMRQLFHVDVFIDLNCYRKYGHNESDEPAFTQPLLYEKIRKKKSIRTLYHDRLVAEGIEVAFLDDEFQRELDLAHTEVKQDKERKHAEIQVPPRRHFSFSQVDTRVEEKKLLEIATTLSTVPDAFIMHPRLKAMIDKRRVQIEKEGGQFLCDWAFAESLALGSLLSEKIPVRLAGQDSRRGTFSQRHGVWIDQKTENAIYPLKAFSEDFELIDSSLSEFAALGFEYGYSLARKGAIVAWEAQFGDFVNAAQVVIDQYIASGEQKWQAISNLILLLPHGYEGQGPEHSSARIERFLTLCANDNMIVVNPTTPSQYFHLLRRQHKMAKPLIVFTPKGLLRLPECKSSLEEIAGSYFEEVVDDVLATSDVKRLIFCQGRFYYDLVQHKKRDTAFIRIEQLYPLHIERIREILAKYKGSRQFIWAQEEPMNMGAWSYIKPILQALLPTNATLEYRGRESSSSPACGSHIVHDLEHEQIIHSLFKEA